MAREPAVRCLLCRHGFTLWEAIVALAIVSVLMVIAVPTWVVLVPTYSLNSAARQVQSELHRIKMQAVAENVLFRLAFSQVPGSYTIQRVGTSTTNLGTKLLPAGIDVRRSITLGFTSRGTASPGGGGTVKLCNSRGVGTNVVLSATGRIRICRTSVCDGAC